MCISAAKPLRSLVPAFDRLMPGHAVQNSMPLPLNPLFGLSSLRPFQQAGTSIDSNKFP
jgi:hypothetical protein